MHVVIVESPAKCKTINKYLGKDYVVLASFGHIRDLPSKDGSVRPDEDFAMDYEISDKSTRHVKAIADAVKGAETLILATDPDREGEAISWHVLQALKDRKALKKETKIQRVVFHSITKKAVQEAMEHPRDVDMNMVNAQQARRALDYLVGFNISPVLWRKLPGSKSAGRVQSVALRLICERQKEIERFIPQEYWHVEAACKSAQGTGFTANLSQLNGEKIERFTLSNAGTAEAASTQAKAGSYTVSTVDKKQIHRKPYAPFTTSTLQQDAFNKLGFGAKKTMTLAQKLYEGVDTDGETAGVITYMRTDAVNVAPEAIYAARDAIAKQYGAKYLPEKPRFYQSSSKNAQEAHEAIRPTDPLRTPDYMRKFLDTDSARLYELIWRRMVASQMAAALIDQVGVDIASNDKKVVFRASGSTIVFDGFLTLYSTRDSKKGEEETILPPLQEGSAIQMESITPHQHFTLPPPRYTEASLVKQLEKLGIGRPSTYASIISIIQERGYVRLDKKRFVPEPRGMIVTEFLMSFFSHYVEYEFTAQLEGELDDISNGELDWKAVLHKFWKEFHQTVDEAKKLEIKQVISTLNQALEFMLFPGEGDLEQRRKCPKCGEGKLSLKMGKFGPFIGCSVYPDCKFTSQLDTEAGAGEGKDNEDGSASKFPALFETRVLGVNDEGYEVSARKGPYGFYVQLDLPDKPKRSGLPKTMNPQEVTLEQALKLLSLPREVGIHPDSGKKVTANIGRFGPYIQHEKTFVSLKQDDVLTVGMNRAMELLSTAKTKAKAEPLAVLGKHPDSGEEIAVYEGRYGPYIKHGKQNITLPKGMTPQSVTLESALPIIANAPAKAGKQGKAKKKAPRKKAK